MVSEKFHIFVNNLYLITLLEVILVVLFLIFGFFSGKLLANTIKKIVKETLFISFLKSIVTLIIPLITVIFLFLDLFILDQLHHKPILTILGIKIAIACFAVVLVKLLTTKNVTGWFFGMVIAPVTILNLFGFWTPFAIYLNSMVFPVGKITVSIYQLLKTVFVVVILFRFTGLITRIGEQRLKKLRRLKISDKILILKVLQVIIYFIILLIALDLLGIDITTLTVFSGALGVGLGFGLQKVTSNFISGIIILLEKSIEIGDLVELNDGTNGIIKRTGARYILLETSQGKEVLVPNEDFITQRVTNWTYTSHKCRIEVPIGVSYNTDLELAQKIILETIQVNPNISKIPEPACYLRDFGLNSVNFLLLFWIDDVVKGRYKPQSEVMFAIWRKFKEYGIQIFYSPPPPPPPPLSINTHLHK